MPSPLISVVIPFKNSRTTFEECLAALQASEFRDFEVVCVNDGSTDGSELIPPKCGFSAHPNTRCGGVASARNCGAELARGEILFFIDSDVMVGPETLGRLARHFQDPSLDAAVGLQSLLFRYGNFSSAFKNLWMHFTYVRLPPKPLALFYTTVASIRREVFLRVGGFDEAFRAPNVEDTVFGHQIHARGARVFPAQDVQVEHARYYSFRELLRTDFQRSRCLTAFILGRGLRALLRGNQTSVPGGYMMAAGLGPFLWGGLIFSLTRGGLLWLTMWLIIPAGFFLVNREFLGFVWKSEGARFAWKSWWFLWIDILAVDLGIVSGMLDTWRGSPYVERGRHLT